MAGQDEKEAYIDKHFADLGFSISGIADMLNHLLVAPRGIGRRRRGGRFQWLRRMQNVSI